MPRVTGTPGTAVSGFTPSTGAGLGQNIAVLWPKDLHADYTRTVSEPDFSAAATIDPTAAQYPKFEVGDAGLLVITIYCNVAAGELRFRVLPLDEDGVPMGADTQAMSYVVNASSSYQVEGQGYLAIPTPIVIDVSYVNKFVVLVSNVQTGTWKFRMRLYC